MAAVAIEAISKRFRLQADKPRSFKERLIRRRGRVEEFWALRDVTFSVDEGETFGLIGHNGSGKSTLLKLLGGIMRPTSGTIAVRGRVASLLELGAGMNEELTGRENVFLNGAILGFSKRELERRFDEIVDFAELEGFIDQQVKHYSSGMFVRLAFSVAINVDPDVLLVDEVLSVGDETFQQKCLDRVQSLQRDGKTIIIVTHSMDIVRRFCHQAAVLDHGQLVCWGDTETAVAAYREELLAQQRDRTLHGARRREQRAAATGSPATARAASPTTGEVAAIGRGSRPDAPQLLHVSDLVLEHASGEAHPVLLTGDPLTVRVSYERDDPACGDGLAIAITDLSDGHLLFSVDAATLGVELPPVAGPGTLAVRLAGVPLLGGQYAVHAWVAAAADGRTRGRGLRSDFSVVSPPGQVGKVAIPAVADVEVQVG